VGYKFYHCRPGDGFRKKNAGYFLKNDQHSYWVVVAGASSNQMAEDFKAIENFHCF